MDVVFAPSAAGMYQAKWEFTYGCSCDIETNYLQGVALDPDLELQTTRLDLGRAYVGGSTLGRVRVTNHGGRGQILGAEIEGAGFSVGTALPLEVAFGEVGDIDVVFEPDGPGTWEALLTLAWEGGSGSVELRGYTDAAPVDFVDEDGDGYTLWEGDCDDARAAIHPAAEEEDNGVDDDCDGEVDERAADLDVDGFSVEQGDCDDDNPFVFPGSIIALWDEPCMAGAELPVDWAPCPREEEPGGCGCAAAPDGGISVAGWAAAGAFRALGRRR